MKREKCPSTNKLIGFFDPSASEENKAKILNHVRFCPECQAVFSAIWEIQFEGEDILRELQGMEISAETKRRLRARAHEEIRRLRQQRSLKGQKAIRWIRVPAVGAALALFLVVIALMNTERFRRHEVERRVLSAKIVLLQPKDRLSARVPIFLWKPSDEVESCHLEIFDRNLNLVFHSDPSASEKLVLPENFLASMSRGTVYFWKIVATLKDGQTTESEFAKFILQK